MTRIAAIFDREAQNWDAEHGPESPRAGEFRARADFLRALCRKLGRPRVIDFGCGTGQQLLDLADVIESGLGIDLSPAMIAHARTHAARLGRDADFVFRVGDIAGFVPTERFDLALFIGALEHLPDPRAALAAAARLLDTDGRIVVVMPHPWSPGVLRARLSARRGRDGRDIAPVRHLTPRRLARLARRAGLRTDSVRGLPYRATAPASEDPARPRPPILSGAYAAVFAPRFSG